MKKLVQRLLFGIGILSLGITFTGCHASHSQTDSQKTISRQTEPQAGPTVCFGIHGGGTGIRKNDTQIVFQTVVGSVRLCTFDPAYIISVYTDTVTVCPLRILGVKSIRKMKSNAIVLLCTPKIFCIYPDGGIRALLEILMFKWEIKYGNMSLLIVFFTAVI